LNNIISALALVASCFTFGYSACTVRDNFCEFLTVWLIIIESGSARYFLPYCTFRGAVMAKDDIPCGAAQTTDELGRLVRAHRKELADATPAVDANTRLTAGCRLG